MTWQTFETTKGKRMHLVDQKNRTACERQMLANNESGEIAQKCKLCLKYEARTNNDDVGVV